MLRGVGEANLPDGELTRRQLLVGSGAALVALVAGCSSDEAGGDATTTLLPDAETVTTRPPPSLSGDPFQLGVASGDPRPDGVVLWTRLAPEPLAEDGLGGMPDEEVDVRWEVAADESFADVLHAGVAVAAPRHAHAVHVEVEGLEPATDYVYRFRVGDHTSPSARTRTLPTGSPDRFGLAFVNCQWFETGAYAAYRHLLDEDVDLVVHLGDYIYEYPSSVEGDRTTLPSKGLETLTDYRLRHASYRLDDDLRNAHHRFPFVLTWDDHEVANNYMGDELVLQPGDADAARARKAAAYQAWWEHLPVRAGPPDDGELVVYQHLDVGDLARLYLLDQRQFADVPPCRDGDPLAEDFGDCAERQDDRTLLGAEQEDWFTQTSDASTAVWNLVGNPVVLGGIDGGNDADGPAYYLDSWDGYPTARHRFIEQLAAIDNPVVFTGDYHAGMLIDVHERPFEDSPVVAPELMAPPISSPLFAADVTDRSPQVRQQLNGHGYLAVEVTPTQVRAAFQVLDDVADPQSAIATRLSCTITAGSPDAEISA
jgi:alkaline phosphatase D